MSFSKAICLTFSILLLTACVSKPPKNVDNICTIFKQYPQWKREAEEVQHRWWVPVTVQMAIIHQESKFDARAQPKRGKSFWIIPGKRPSNAYGYTQALRPTWKEYKKSTGTPWSSRKNFSDAVDFIGWYADKAYKRAGIHRNDAYSLYLAYHEGIGGYQRQTYLQKPWLVLVAKKVKLRAEIYASQLAQCKL